jgi:hypothetical protein
MYMNTLIAYIDKGIPVIAWGTPLVGVFVGYEDYGKVLLYITGNNDKTERVSLEKIIHGKVENSQYGYQSPVGGWVFVGSKKENVDLAQLYRNAIFEIPKHFSIKTDLYCFGPEALRSWANDIENGKFDGMKPEDFDGWAYHTNNICVLATNSGCSNHFINKALELNPDMGYLSEIRDCYNKTSTVWNDLESLGGGFNVTLEALQVKEKRSEMANKIREAADCMDEVVQKML